MKPTVAMFAALAILGIGTAARSDANGYLTSIGAGDTTIPVVVVAGTPYEMGRRQGELIREDATQFIHTLMERIQAGDPERYSDANLDGAWEAVTPHTDPRFHEELRGLAEGLRLPLETLQRAHAVPIVADYACSSIAAWGGATKDGHLYQTRNLDWHMGLSAQDHPLIVVYKPIGGIPHVNITFAGYIGANTGLNAEGMTLSEMGDSPGDDYPFHIDGVHFTTLFRTVMYDAKSLDDAVEMFQSAPRIKKYHYVVGDGVAPDASSIGAVKMLAHAPDLTIWKDNDSDDELAPQVFRHIVYQDEGRGAYGPLQRVYGNIGSDELVDIACRIPIKGGNVLNVVYDATDLECWISYARGDVEAYQRPFVHFRLRDHLD